jgi:2-methylcitrate dehydratase PrpD
MAALLNGFSVAAEQFQDGHRLGRGHPASHVVPAVFAVAEARGSTGIQMLSSVLAGYEVGVRIGESMGGTPDGVHDIATWGTIGAAVGVAHLLSDGSPDTIEAAIELAASMPLLPNAASVFDGATVQHAFLGMGAHHGVLWGSMAGGGLRAPAGTLEGHFGKWSGRSFQPSLVHGAPDEQEQWPDYEVLSGYIKRHPTCAHLHGVNDAMEDILQEWTGTCDDVESVLVETYGAAAVFDNPEPQNDLAARFSIPYTVAVALVSGHFDNTSFDARWLDDGRVRRVAKCVEVRHSHELDRYYPAGRPARITLVSSGSPILHADTLTSRGDGSGALDDSDVISKPRRVLRARVSDQRADDLLDAVQTLPTCDVATLSLSLRRVFD